MFVRSIQRNETSISDYIVPGGKLTKEKSIEVYTNDYYARLQDALGENYEAVWTVVGDEDFYALGQSYIKKYPSELRDLTSYGDKFSALLRESELLSDYPFLIDLAEFEREFWNIFHRKRESFEIPWEEYLENFSSLTFSFSCNFKIYRWNYRVYEIFQYRDTGFGDIAINFANPQSIILYKTGANISVQEVSDKNYYLIKCLMEGKCLGDIIENSDIDIDENDIQTTFAVLQQSQSFFPKKNND